MGKASDNADVLIKNLRILYNQTRQTSITNEIIANNVITAKSNDKGLRDLTTADFVDFGNQYLS